MNATEVHPMHTRTVRNLHTAARLLEGEGWQRGRFGVFDATAEACDTAYEQIVADRALNFAGIDVFWDNLVCADGADAAAAVTGACHFDFRWLYGGNYKAVLGLIKAACEFTDGQVHGLGNLYEVSRMRLFQRGYEWLEQMNIHHIVDDVSSDLAFAIHRHDALTPSKIMHNLEALGVLQCVAICLILGDRFAVDTPITPFDVAELTEPFLRMFPESGL